MLFVVLSVLALLFLAAIVASPARADLVGDVGGVGDQVTEEVEIATPPVTDEGTTVDDEATPGEEEVIPAPIDQVGEEEISPVGDEAVAVSESNPSVGTEGIDAATAALVVAEVLDGAESVLPVEELLIGDAVSPVEEALEDAPAFDESVEEVPAFVTDVVIMVPTEVVDMVRVLPLLVPPPVASPGPIEIPTVPVTPTISIAGSMPSPEPVNDIPQQSSGLFSKELLAEMTLFDLTELTVGSTTGGSTSPAPERKTAPLAAYKPVAGTLPVVGGAGASSSSGSNHAGGGSFGGLDAFSFSAAMAALLALCLLGWIRDRSRSGRSIFPSHGGRPG
ncbi:MAG TPA: hypothetical protein VJQ79_16435 [Acidimicrobiia bacterium]|nr:hypothetical protein [Acidimicrobiia bacterium]